MSWELILLGVLAGGLILSHMKDKATKAIGTLICLVIPIFILFYMLIVGRYEIVLYVVGIITVYAHALYSWGKNQKKEDSK